MSAPEGNKYAIGNNGGRPAIYETPEALISACDEYFEYIKGEAAKNKDDEIDYDRWVREPEPATVTGLVLFLGFSSRQSLDDYAKKEEFSDIIKKARLRVENKYELKLHGTTNTGAIFALKNMGWKDKIETGLTDKDGNDVQATPSIVVVQSTGGISIKEDEE